MSQNSQKFKPGDKVRCINDDACDDLTVNKIYTILECENKYVYIESDENINSHFFDYRFVLAETKMKTPHKHAELIKAWAYGAEIQYRRYTDDPWKDINMPTWSLDCEYRIKPEVKPDIVRYATLNLPTVELNYWFNEESESTNVKATWKHDGEQYQLHSITRIK